MGWGDGFEPGGGGWGMDGGCMDGCMGGWVGAWVDCFLKIDGPLQLAGGAYGMRCVWHTVDWLAVGSDLLCTSLSILSCCRLHTHTLYIIPFASALAWMAVLVSCVLAVLCAPSFGSL